MDKTKGEIQRLNEDEKQERKITDYIPNKKKEIDYRDFKLHINITPDPTEEEKKHPEILDQGNFHTANSFAMVCETLPTNSEYTGFSLQNPETLQNMKRYQSSEVEECLSDHELRLENLESIVSENFMLKVERDQKNREIDTLKLQVNYLKKMVAQWDKRIINTTQEIHNNFEQKMPIVNYVYNYLKVVEAERMNTNQNSTTEKNDPKNDKIIF